MDVGLPILLFLIAGVGLGVSMIVLGSLIGPRRRSPAKDMPYESGMDPIHDTHRRFDVRFHLLAIAFLVFDVEILFLYPWAVAMNNPEGIPYLTQPQGDLRVVPAPELSRELVFGGAMFFFFLLAAGWLYDWKKGVYTWR